MEQRSAPLRLIPYRLPLRRPWRSAHGELNDRQGWLVTAGRGPHRGHGDCAPLPDAGTETLENAAARLAHWQARAHDQSDQQLLDALRAASPSPTPAADAAVETALLDQRARAAGLPLRALLHPTAAKVVHVPVNAALGTLIACTPRMLQQAARQGFRVVKLKVGTAPLEAELAHLRTLLAAAPHTCQLRLDANGAWDLPDAHRFLAALEHLPPQPNTGIPIIESLEEPLRQPRDEALAQLQAATSIPLALDESLPQHPWPTDASQFPVRRIILKPGVLGGLRPSLDRARLALTAGIQPLVTSLIDSAAGIWAAAELAAAITALSREIPEGADCHNLCQGLATADWLAADLGQPPSLSDGRLRLSARPGSGFLPFGKGDGATDPHVHAHAGDAADLGAGACDDAGANADLGPPA
ncbi:L-Ala-D/L-Glu epimerase [Thiorhodovibrio winogradskyi]|uniref:o-succinylbenzoate synthase n=1 Tax=Thiorhodovibrio winogradskyi TaxID=77007 RepID=A0ABZ0SBL2_9GAMM|nr:o-succinylbenzoate synthase [Thiorhodovibrio winogradskyi]